MSTTVVVVSTVAATITVLSLLRYALWPRHPKILQSPLRHTITKLDVDAIDKLDYSPDAFPGARDVMTPVSDRVFRET
jgi:hypothetical protein